MKKYLLLFFGTVLFFSCSKDALIDPGDASAEIESQTEKKPKAVSAESQTDESPSHYLFSKSNRWAFFDL